MEVIPAADDLSSFLAILPPAIRGILEKDSSGLYEVVLDLVQMQPLPEHTVGRQVA